MVSAPASRRIELVSAALMSALDISGALPRSYEGAAVRGADVPDKSASYGFLVEWEGAKVAGYAAYQDRYDAHAAVNIREIVSVGGSRRAIVALVRHVIMTARETGRRACGAVDDSNAALKAVLMHFAKPTRVVFEDLP